MPAAGGVRLNRQVLLRERVAHKTDGIEHEVSDHQRGQSSVLLIEVPEDDSHGEVSDESAKALVQVVAASQCGRRQDDGPFAKLQAFKSFEQVTDNYYLFY